MAELVGPKVDHHMMGGGCCVSFKDLGAKSALADWKRVSFSDLETKSGVIFL